MNASITSPATTADSLLDQFYAWERRGRGWQLWDDAVVLEPPFAPFFGHAVIGKAADDGRRHTLASTLVLWLSRTLRGTSAVPAPHDSEEMEEPGPAYAPPCRSIAELRLSLPSDMEVSKEQSEQLLATLGNGLLSFEIMGTAESVIFQYACDQAEVGHLKDQLTAYFPSIAVTTSATSLEEQWHTTQGESLIAEFGLAREFMLPLASPRTFGVDPLISIIGALSNLSERQLGCIQILFQPTHHRWAESILRAVTYSDGTSFFDGSRDFIEQATTKIASPLYAVVIRVAAKSP